MCRVWNDQNGRHGPPSAVTEPQTAIFVRADDGRAVANLRAAARHGLNLTMFAGSMDPRAVRLAAAADAELGAISPDAHRATVLCPNGPPRIDPPHGLTLVLPTPDGQGWHIHGLHQTPRPAIELDDVAVLQQLLADGHALGPIGEIPPVVACNLEGLRIVHVASTTSSQADGRMLTEVEAARHAGAHVEVLQVDAHSSRTDRIRSGWRLLRHAGRTQPDVIHIHDPELLPAGVLITKRGRCSVVHETHSDLRSTARSLIWIPSVIRRPFARLAGRLENILSARIAAVVTPSRDVAIQFAARGANAIALVDPSAESAKLTALYGRLTRRAD